MPKITSREIFFYHSFPRHHKYDNKRRTLALRTLASILKNGLLLTAEPFPEALGVPPVKHVQHRACFTALHPRALKKHCRRFGSFSLEFGGSTMREFGAQPAFYLAAPLPGAALLNQAGSETAFHLHDAYVFLHKMWVLKDQSVPNFVAEAARHGLKYDPKKIAKLRRSVLHVSKALWQPRMNGHAFQHMVFGLEALLNLYYQTEAPGNTPLQFFEQREWKISRVERAAGGRPSRLLSPSSNRAGGFPAHGLPSPGSFGLVSAEFIASRPPSAASATACIGLPACRW